MTAPLWRELATYAALATIIAATLTQLDGHTRTAITLGIIGGTTLAACLTIQALGIA